MKIDRSYDIQRSIQTKTKMSGFVDFQDVLLLFLYFMVLMKLAPLFPEHLAIYIIIVNLMVMVFWIWPSKVNTKMKQGQTLFRILVYRGVTYHAIDKEGNSIGGKR
ncbi:DUF5592 family protein [Listeria booriae]|uniref:DUF5592 family protein n=1 Tax=Listeria booriae TaxID=1552123 RepID=UPI001E5CF8FB|nr:DUF5592 family protein [Listeria booriae]MCD2208590.1 DUF5592 family protein [Listeria booriae]